jgi:acetyl esterase
VLAWLADAGGDIGVDPGRLALAGDSAGAQLVTATAADWANSLPVPRHVGLFYPLLDPAAGSASMDQFGEGYMLNREFIDWAWEAYCGQTSCRTDPRFDLSGADLTSFPPTTIITAELDPLRDEGEAFGQRLAVLGIDAEVHRFPGMIHGFAGLPQTQAKAEAAIALIAARIGAALRT